MYQLVKQTDEHVVFTVLNKDETKETKLIFVLGKNGCGL